MDMMAMVSSMLAMKAAGTQQQIQTSIIKQNADAEKAAVQTLLARPISPPALAAISILRPEIPADTHLSDLILRSRVSGVSKDEWHQPGHMVRDGATRLLTMRV